MIADFDPNCTTRQLNENDWSHYKDFCARLLEGQNLEDLAAFVCRKNPDDPQSWRDRLTKKDIISFGLFHKDNLIGHACIVFSDQNAEFTGIAIEPSYRKNGLADTLHHARKRYLQSINFKGEAFAQILEENTRSIEAASRNGFEAYGSRIDGEGNDATKYHLLRLRTLNL